MDSITTIIGSYPTVIFTVLLGVVLLYWVLALVGLVDFEHGGIEIDLSHEMDLHADDADLTDLASYVVAFGLNGVPFSIVISLIVLFSWLFTGLAAQYLLPYIPTSLLTFLVGTAIMVLGFCLAIVVTARVIRPMRGLFVTHNARSNQSLVGLGCKILTGEVTEKFGRAEVAVNDATINIRVWANSPNALAKGARAIIIDYDAATSSYQVEPE